MESWGSSCTLPTPLLMCLQRHLFFWRGWIPLINCPSNEAHCKWYGLLECYLPPWYILSCYQTRFTGGGFEHEAPASVMSGNSCLQPFLSIQGSNPHPEWLALRLKGSEIFSPQGGLLALHHQHLEQDISWPRASASQQVGLCILSVFPPIVTLTH